MKTFLKTFAVIIIIVFAEKLSAQGSAVGMLYFNPSPKLTGLGMSGTSLPSDDPAGFYYNPALLGYISQTNNIALQVYPSNVDWLPNIPFSNPVKYRNISFNIGYNFENLLNGIKLSAGFGYIHSKMDFGNFDVLGPDSPNPLYSIAEYDQYDAYGIGVGIDYFVQFSIGITYKNISSQLPGFTNGAIRTFDAKVSAVDYGLLLTVPVTKLIFPELQFAMLRDVPAYPFLNFSLGYSQLNVGNEIYYLDRAQADPLPRTARLGYTISTGINIKLNNSTLKAIGYDFTVDADDILVETSPHADTSMATSLYTYSYQKFLGDISIGRNLIGLKSSDNVVVHKGHNISLFETLSFQIGRFDGRGYYNDKSSGFGIQSKGIFTLLKGFTKNNIFDFIADHLDVQYYSSKLFADSPLETKFEGINVVWSGMML